MQRNFHYGFKIAGRALAIYFLTVLVLMATGVTTLATGNFWFTEGGVLRELRLEHPNAVSVVKVERHAWAYSRIVVRNQDGSLSTHKLNSNIFFNYRLK